MSRFVLVHGSWHGGWSWAKVVPVLEAAGHVVDAPDLPGHGDDDTPLGEITLDAYARRIGEVLDARPEPAILVGHSHGGVVITQVAEDRPEQVVSLVYLGAFLPRDGESLLDLALGDPESLLVPNLVFSDDRSTAVVRPEVVREVFYADCTDEDATAAARRLVPEPMASPATPVRTTAERFGRLPRTYVHTLNDRAVGPELQRQMFEATPCRVVTMPASHSPFLSMPDELAAHLMDAAAAFPPPDRAPAQRAARG